VSGRVLGPLAIALTGCAAVSSSFLLPDVIALATPPGRVADGSGQLDPAATVRLTARQHAALAEATHGAIEAATRAPADLRLQRRAAAMVRAMAADSEDKTAIGTLAVAPLLEHLVGAQPCPGLVDAAATWHALGEQARAGEAYLRASSECGSIEAAIAAVAPLRTVDRCDDAIAGLRAAWPRVRAGRKGAWIEVFDAVASCSDAVTLRRNLAFAPTEVVEDYVALRAARRQEELERDRERAAEQREEAERDRARQASWRCESECSAAVSSCSSSCTGEPSCSERCASVGHVCRSGCGGF